jgi:succinate dehydrogenase / fumarate reductase, cytochrome b subunit
MIMAQSGSRPISPHLGVYKWGPHMAVSILHRLTGDGLALVGTLVLVWWLYAVAAGAETYATFLSCAGSIPGQIVLIGLTWAFFQHMCSGLRHFVLDVGAGYELDANKRWSIISLIIPAFGTAATWLYIYFERLVA